MLEEQHDEGSRRRRLPTPTATLGLRLPPVLFCSVLHIVERAATGNGITISLWYLQGHRQLVIVCAWQRQILFTSILPGFACNELTYVNAGGMYRHTHTHVHTHVHTYTHLFACFNVRNKFKLYWHFVTFNLEFLFRFASWQLKCDEFQLVLQPSPRPASFARSPHLQLTTPNDLKCFVLMFRPWLRLRSCGLALSARVAGKHFALSSCEYTSNLNCSFSLMVGIASLRTWQWHIVLKRKELPMFYIVNFLS